METEKELYTRIWKSGTYGASGTVGKAFDVMSKLEGSMLDVGSGTGILVKRLRGAGKESYGQDVTLAGIQYKDMLKYISESPSVNIPHADGFFNHVSTTDFLEHLPEDEVLPTLVEFKRVSTGKTYHWICCRPDVMGAKFDAVLHKTVKPMSWWKAMFIGAGFKEDELELVQAS